MTYKPTGQVILFKGADNPKKLKSTKSVCRIYQVCVV